jgi:protein O-mannosyl-transferase
MWGTDRLGPSLFVAAIFAIHPINVESVAWVAERKNVLCTLFFLLTLWVYGWYARRPSYWSYMAVAGLFVCGLASKPMVITLPFVLLLLDYWPLARARCANVGSDQAPTLPWSTLVVAKLPLFALSLASAVITMRAQQAGGAIRTTSEVSFGSRIATAFWAYAMYLWKMLWPARLAPLYPHPGGLLADWQVLVAVVVLLAISAAVWRLRARRYLLVGWLWFLGTLVPVIGLVQVGDAAMADRYAYIPLIGIFVMIAFGVSDFSEQRKLGYWPAIPAGIALLALAATTHTQIGYWQSNYDLWSHTLAVTESNFIAEDNLGGALILEGKEEEAHPHFEAAARINPKDPMSRSNLGTYFQTHNQMRDAIAQYEAAVELTSDPGLLAQTYANLGAAHRALGEDEQAQKNFEQSLRFNPNQFNSWLGLGLLAQKQGKLDEAISDLSRSVELQPSAEGYLELGRTLVQAGHVPEALNAYQQALKLAPNLSEAQQGIDALRQKIR